MNKTTVYCVASALAVSMVSSPVLDVMAKTKNETTPIVQEQTPVQIQNAEEFISKYLYVEVNQNDKTDGTNQDKDSVQVLITAATKENYEKLLEGNEVFKTLTVELQNEIKKDYQTEYDKIVKIQEDKNKELDAYTILMNQAADVEKEVQEENKEQSDVSKTQTEQNSESKTAEKEDSKDSTSTEKENSETKDQEDSAAVVKNSDEIDSKFGQPVQDDSSKSESEISSQSAELKVESPVVSNTQPAAESKTSTQSEKQSALQVTLPQVENKAQQSNVAVNQQSEPLVNESSVNASNSQSNQTVSKQASSMSSAAQNFIKTYLTSASGNIFASANSLNYQKIISAMPSWMKLSNTDKNAINDELVSKVGKKYQKLLQEAQQLSIKSGKYVPVNTATNTNTTLYAWLCAVSLGMLTFVLKRLRKQD